MRLHRHFTFIANHRAVSLLDLPLVTFPVVVPTELGIKTTCVQLPPLRAAAADFVDVISQYELCSSICGRGSRFGGEIVLLLSQKHAVKTGGGALQSSTGALLLAPFLFVKLC